MIININYEFLKSIQRFHVLNTVEYRQLKSQGDKTNTNECNFCIFLSNRNEYTLRDEKNSSFQGLLKLDCNYIFNNTFLFNDSTVH